MIEQRIPKAVKDMAQRADDLIKAHAEANPEQLELEVAKPDEVKPVVVAPKPDIEPVKQQEPDRGADYWEHRFKTLEGMYKAHQQRTAEEISTLKVAKDKAESDARKIATQVPKDYDLRKYLSESEIEAYGEDHMKSVLKVAAKLVDERYADTQETIKPMIEQEVTPVRKQMEASEAEAKANKDRTFWQILSSNVPTWATVNKDPAFHQWLLQEDGLSGIRRQDILSNAEKELDPAKVVTVFNAFIKTKTDTQASVQNKLDSKVLPDSINAAPNPQQSDMPSVTKDQIRTFYRDMALGRYKNRVDEAKGMEQRILAAQANGRIR